MSKTLIRASILAILCATAALSSTAADPTPEPLGQTELLALVAGGALPGNLVRQIGAVGLAFHPDDAYRTQLKNAGADLTLLKALDSSHVVAAGASDGKADPATLQHISNAGALIRSEHYAEAVEELNKLLTASFDKPETGFVMGELLRRQERWEEAESVYEKVLQESPDFREVHTKLSYVLYRTDDFEGALREAKAALAATPDNA